MPCPPKPENLISVVVIVDSPVKFVIVPQDIRHMRVHGIQECRLFFMDELSADELSLIVDIEGSRVSPVFYDRLVIVVFQQV
jgi:hypothetical protein